MATPKKPENAPAATPEENSDFDWSDSESVVPHEQLATTCYFNTAGELVIRQRRWPDDDSLIFGGVTISP